MKSWAVLDLPLVTDTGSANRCSGQSPLCPVGLSGVDILGGQAEGIHYHCTQIRQFPLRGDPMSVVRVRQLLDEARDLRWICQERPLIVISEPGYLLNSSDPHRWWFNQHRERRGLDLDGLLSQPVEELAT
jgi:hypothetical protein